MIRWERTLIVDVTVVTNDGQAATVTEPWRISKEDAALVIRTPGNAQTYYLSEKAIEAIYDLHADVPR